MKSGESSDTDPSFASQFRQFRKIVSGTHFRRPTSVIGFRARLGLAMVVALAATIGLAVLLVRTGTLSSPAEIGAGSAGAVDAAASPSSSAQQGNSPPPGHILIPS